LFSTVAILPYYSIYFERKWHNLENERDSVSRTKILVSHALPLRMHANKPPVSQGEKNFIKATDL